MSKRTRPSFAVGDLVEHTVHVGYRGIICDIVKYRAHNHPRIVSVAWFPPTSEAFKLAKWKEDKVTGTTDTSVLDLTRLSTAA
jgi:hypothetical protein